MSRVVVAGIGNVFLGDDGFGVEVVRRLRQAQLPADVEVLDVGLRGLHLAYRLAAGGDLLVAGDAVSRGGAPGTVYVLEPTPDALAGWADAHAMDLASVFATVQALGGTLGRVLVVGCEPAEICERMGLSAAVEGAIDHAIERIRAIAERGGADVPDTSQSSRAGA